MSDDIKHELSGLSHAIRALTNQIQGNGGSRPLSELATKHDLEEMEKRLLKAIKDPASINLAPLTEQLKTGTEALESAVKANQPA